MSKLSSTKMNKFCSANMKGFSLIETVLVSMIALVVGTFLVTILVNETGVFYKQNSIINQGLSLNDVLSDVSNNIMASSSVSVGYPEVNPTTTSSSTALVLKIPSINANGTIANVYDYYVYKADSVNPKILRLNLYPDAQSTRKSLNQVLTTLLQTVNFTYLDNTDTVVTPVNATKVKVTLTVLSKTGSIGEARSSTIITSLRNK